MSEKKLTMSEKLQLHKEEQERKQQERLASLHLPKKEEQTETKTEVVEPKKGTEEAPAQTSAAAAAPPAPPSVNIRNEFFQTPDKITFTFYAKNKTTDDVTVEATERSFRVRIRVDDENTFDYNLTSLFAPIRPKVGEDIVVSVRPMKVEIIVPKVTGAQWPKLEFDAVTASAQSCWSAGPTNGNKPVPATQKDLPVPNSKGRDWNNFKVEEDEEEKNYGGDQGMQRLFREIYRDHDEDTRRAMMKSFQESGGTTLSTNWNDVKDRTVEPQAPGGMEVKKWADRNK